MRIDEHHMELAIAETRQAMDAGEWPFGTIVTRKEDVIARNRCREAAEKTVLAHAELHALMRAKFLAEPI